MNKRPLWFSSLFLCVALGLLAYYVFRVASEARSAVDVAGLVFSAGALAVGLYGAVLASLSYRLQRGRVPRPELKIGLRDTASKRRVVHLDLSEVTFDVGGDLEGHAAWLESRIPSRMVRMLPGGVFGGITDEDVQSYRSKCRKHLTEYEDYLCARVASKAFSSRTAPLLLSVTNVAAVSAEGATLVIDLPTDVMTFDESECLVEPDAPDVPQAPKPRSFSSLGSISSVLDLPSLTELYSSSDIPGDSNPPRIDVLSDGSSRITYEIPEIRHHLGWTNEDAPLLIGMTHPGMFDISYEIHARNLPEPTKGKVTLVVAHRDPADVLRT